MNRPDEREYLDERLWTQARAVGLSRKQFLQRLAMTAGAAVLGGAARRGEAQGSTPTPGLVKPTPADQFYTLGTNREMRWEAMYGRGYLTPNELFFVRNHTSTPRIAVEPWRLKVYGSALSRPRDFTYDELLSMPSVSVIKALECTGNGRSFFEKSHGKKIEGTQWKLGGIGVAEWTGVRLAEVLDRAGVKKSAVDVMPIGLDEQKVRRPMPISRAMHEDTLLVYAMNGQVLPPDHGYPVRVLVPGWSAISSIKWAGSLEVADIPLYSPWNTESYVMVGPTYTPTATAKGPLVTSQVVKSAFELPWDGTLPARRHLLRGRSWSGVGKISRVEVSVDGGRTWQRARLREPNLPQAWTRWDLDWDAPAGDHRLLARATDSRGNTQPATIPFNQLGYLYSAVVEHPIHVR